MIPAHPLENTHSHIPHVFPCLCLAAAMAITPAAAVVSHQEDLDDFGRLAAAALDSVGHFDPIESNSIIPSPDTRMLLDWGRPDSKSDFAFNGDQPNTYVSVHCEQSHAFMIVADESVQAQLNVGACKHEAGRARDLAALAEAAGKAAMAPVFQMVPAASRGKLERQLVYRKIRLRGGLTGYAFTVVAIGHGIIFVNGALVFDPSRDMAFIVQGEVGILCGRSSPDGKTLFSGRPFCSDTSRALLDVAVDLARRYK